MPKNTNENLKIIVKSIISNTKNTLNQGQNFGEKKQKLYEPNIKLSDLTFEDLFYRMRPYIEYHCKNNPNLIKGYNFDDLFQELSYKLWKIRIPDDIVYYDWRFIKYANTAFRFCLYDLAKKKIIKKKDRNEQIVVVFRDCLDNSQSIYDNLNKPK